jgi:diguanylate cyclase (GGDEF)-like protein
MRVIELTDDPRASASDITGLIQGDSGLSSKILKTVNSAFYGLSTPVASIERAQVLLGLKAIKTLALGFSLVQTMDGENNGFDYTGFWRRSVHAAACAKALAARTNCMEPDEALLGGLLADIGMVVLHRTISDRYDTVVLDSGGRHQELVRLELLELDITHAVVGATLAERWRFPASLIAPIRYHDQPTAAPRAQQTATKCVGVASLGASALTEADPTPSLRQYINRAKSWFALEQDEAESLLQEASEIASAFAKLLNVQVGPPANAQSLLEEANQKIIDLSIEDRLGEAVADVREDNGIDEATGAISRRHLLERLEDAYQRTIESEGDVTLAVVDIAEYRALRSEDGEAVASEVLREVARRLEQFFKRLGGDVARVNAETFGVLLPGVDHENAVKLCRRLTSSMKHAPFVPCAEGAKERELQLRIGLTTADPRSIRGFTSSLMLLSAAERALEAARQTQGAAVRVFIPQASVAV